MMSTTVSNSPLPATLLLHYVVKQSYDLVGHPDEFPLNRLNTILFYWITSRDYLIVPPIRHPLIESPKFDPLFAIGGFKLFSHTFLGNSLLHCVGVLAGQRG